MKERDLYWDTLKFMLIFLVVYGHTISTFSPCGSFNNATYNLIFIFHMPLFIFVSGRFSHINNKSKYIQSILRILETYIVFQFLRSFMPVLLGESFTFQTILSFLLRPQYTLWYLLCLVYWRLLVLIIPKRVLDNHPILILGISIVVCIFGGFIPIPASILSIQRAMSFLPFFFMGYYSAEIDLMKYIRKINIGIPIISIIAVFLFIYFFLNTELGFVLYAKSSYWSHPIFSPYTLCMFRLLLFLAASFLGIMVMRLVRVQPFMAKLGGATLFIYIFHSFVVQVFRAIAGHGYIPCDEILLFLYAIFITLGLAYLSRFRIVNTILNPITFYIERCNNKNKDSFN